MYTHDKGPLTLTEVVQINAMAFCKSFDQFLRIFLAKSAELIPHNSSNPTATTSFEEALEAAQWAAFHHMLQRLPHHQCALDTGCPVPPQQHLQARTASPTLKTPTKDEAASSPSHSVLQNHTVPPPGRSVFLKSLCLRVSLHPSYSTLRLVTAHRSAQADGPHYCYNPRACEETFSRCHSPLAPHGSSPWLTVTLHPARSRERGQRRTEAPPVWR